MQRKDNKVWRKDTTQAMSVHKIDLDNHVKNTVDNDTEKHTWQSRMLESKDQ